MGWASPYEVGLFLLPSLGPWPLPWGHRGLCVMGIQPMSSEAWPPLTGALIWGILGLPIQQRMTSSHPGASPPAGTLELRTRPEVGSTSVTPLVP